MFLIFLIFSVCVLCFVIVMCFVCPMLLPVSLDYPVLIISSLFESCTGEVYSIEHYVIKFVSDLQQVGGFLRVLLFPPPIKLTATI